MKPTYHGWVVVDEEERVSVEYTNAGGKRTRKAMGKGNAGCLDAIQWWDKKVGKPINLQPLMKGCYRVYSTP